MNCAAPRKSRRKAARPGQTASGQAFFARVDAREGGIDGVLRADDLADMVGDDAAAARGF